MFNPIKMAGNAITNKINKTDMADLGKFAAGVLMIVGGVVILKCGNVDMNEVNEAFDTKIDIKPVDVDQIEIVDAVVETVTDVAEAASK